MTVSVRAKGAVCKAVTVTFTVLRLVLLEDAIIAVGAMIKINNINNTCPPNILTGKPLDAHNLIIPVTRIVKWQHQKHFLDRSLPTY